MTTVIIILAIALIIEIVFSPRLGFTTEDKILLWYGKSKRNYIVLWQYYFYILLPLTKWRFNEW